MSDVLPTEAIAPTERELLSGAERRLNLATWVLGIAGIAICWLWYGTRGAGGFAAGAILSAVNFRWLKGAANAVSALAVGGTESTPEQAAGHPQPAGLVIRLLLRYALIGVAGYAIFKSSFFSLGAFFAGLFLFLGAILVEVAYEICRSLNNA